MSDLEWFRDITTLVAELAHRARRIDLTWDWWRVDDLALRNLPLEGRVDLHDAHRSGRFLATYPEGDGQDALDWLGGVAGGRARTGP